MDVARRRTLTLVLCCMAQFMVILDVSIVNVALPSIREDLGFAGADLQWVVNAYTLAFGGFPLLGGRAAALLRRRRSPPRRPGGTSASRGRTCSGSSTPTPSPSAASCSSVAVPPISSAAARSS